MGQLKKPSLRRLNSFIPIASRRPVILIIELGKIRPGEVASLHEFFVIEKSEQLRRGDFKPITGIDDISN